MPNNSTVQTSNFIEVSEDFGLYLSSNEELPPTLCPELIPAGWELAHTEDGDPDGTTFEIAGEYVEAYFLQRVT